VRDGEDDVEVFGIEQVGLTIVEPLGARQRLALGAAPRAARVVPDALVTTAIALLDMAAKRRGATKLDRVAVPAPSWPLGIVPWNSA
jgi:hypothetical protein